MYVLKDQWAQWCAVYLDFTPESFTLDISCTVSHVQYFFCCNAEVSAITCIPCRPNSMLAQPNLFTYIHTYLIYAVHQDSPTYVDLHHIFTRDPMDIRVLWMIYGVEWNGWREGFLLHLSYTVITELIRHDHRAGMLWSRSRYAVITEQVHCDHRVGTPWSQKFTSWSWEVRIIIPLLYTTRDYTESD